MATSVLRAPRAKLSTRIVETLREDLVGGVIPAGAKLPTEVQLTVQFGVSRTVVREAIAALSADGLVEPRQGSGVFATRPPAALGAESAEMGRRVSSALDVLEVRLAIEVESAALAALRRNPSQEAAIQEAFFEFERLLQLGEPTGGADLAFHRAIAAATGNPFYLDVLDALGRKTIPRDVTSQDSSDANQDRDYQTRLQREHLAILSGISKGNTDAAREAMRLHLTNSQSRYRARLERRQASYAAGVGHAAPRSGLVDNKRDGGQAAGDVSKAAAKTTPAKRPVARRTTATKRKPGAAKAPPAPVQDGRPLLVIDGDSFAHRAYHALPKTIRRKGNKGAGAIVGFANYLLRFFDAEKPRAVVVAWDTLEVPNWRVKLFPPYQGGREFDVSLVEQLDALPELVAAFGFANAKGAGFEADDFLAAAVAREEKRGGTVIVASGDRDTFQLASPATTILHPITGGQMARIGPDEVRERYGVEPKQVPDFIALRGDPSDKIPGAKGIGAQGAARFLSRYPSLDAALAAGQFASQADALRLYKHIATMDASAPLPRLPDRQPDWASAAALAHAWELNDLAKRLAQRATSEDQ